MSESEIVILSTLKLIGPIMPIGESEKDEITHQNLQTMCALVSELLSKIDDVEYLKSRSSEGSVLKSVNYAKHFLDSLGYDNCPKCNRQEAIDECI